MSHYSASKPLTSFYEIFVCEQNFIIMWKNVSEVEYSFGGFWPTRTHFARESNLSFPLAVYSKSINAHRPARSDLIRDKIFCVTHLNISWRWNVEMKFSYLKWKWKPKWNRVRKRERAWGESRPEQQRLLRTSWMNVMWLMPGHDPRSL